MRAHVELLGAVLATMAWTACSDGVGTPIQRQAPDQALDRDGASDEDDDFDEAHCRDALDWPASYQADEDELLAAINALRARSVACGDREEGDLPPLRAAPALRCSARLHSRDMVERGFIDTINPDGDGPRDRMRAAGYRVEDSDESLVPGERDAQGVLERLLDSRDGCENLSSWRHEDVGIGRYQDRWTLDFASD